MAQTRGLRERKKARTRASLVENGLRMFDSQGYEATTVAQIAEAADVAPATFFTYFPTKEHLVFADYAERVDGLGRSLLRREPDESPRQALTRGVRDLLEVWSWPDADRDALAATRARVVLTTPALRSAALGRLFDAQGRWADALLRAFPDRFAPDTAHAVVGAVVGAAMSAAVSHLERGGDRPLGDVVMSAVGAALTGVE